MANGIVLGGKLKFRKTASTSGTVITSIPTGTVLSVSAVSGNDSWYQTTYSTYGTGYVMKSFVAVASDTVEVNATNVNVRNSANGSTVLYTLSSPATATVQDVSSNWVKIQPSGKKVGWIKADYVNKKSSGSSSSGGNSSGGGSSSSSDLVGKSGMVAVNASGLNVRSSANGSLLSYKLYNGEKFTILEVSTAGGYTWYRVQDSQNRTNGWVRSDFIAVDTSSGGTTSKRVLGAKFTGCCISSISDYVPMRSDPRASSAQIYPFEIGTFRTCYAFTGVGTTDEQRQWLWVDYGPHSGYVCARYICGVNGKEECNATVADPKGVNLRLLPSTSSTRLYGLGQDENLTILDTSVAGWYRVATSHGTGWVAADYVTKK